MTTTNETNETVVTPDPIEYPIITTYVFRQDAWVEGVPEVGEAYKVTTEKSEGVFRSIEGIKTEDVLETKITRLAFKQRMTPSERIAVRTASETDPIIFDFMDLVTDAQFIDLSRSDTISGVTYLEMQGVLEAGRASEILNNPVKEEEKL